MNSKKNMQNMKTGPLLFVKVKDEKKKFEGCFTEEIERREVIRCLELIASY